MKIIALLVAASTLASSAPASLRAAAPHPASVCLYVNDIQRTETPDDRTIIFYMRGGKVWRNTLKTACPMLKVSPYTEVLHDDRVCANQQFIHVALTGDNCVLGDFTPLPDQR